MAVPSLGDLFDTWFGGAPGAGLRRSIPTQLTIPDLGVDAPVVEVGRAKDGSIGTPLADPVNDAGWYGRGPSPGEPGTAIIVGHIDTKTEPAVFAPLVSAQPGTVIEVARQDGTTARFAVDSVESFPKTAFPAERIFDRLDRPRLVLVTCGGRWLGGDVGYADNVIVFASLQ